MHDMRLTFTVAPVSNITASAAMTSRNWSGVNPALAPSLVHSSPKESTDPGSVPELLDVTLIPLTVCNPHALIGRVGVYSFKRLQPW
jgi:hypothetical protein